MPFYWSFWEPNVLSLSRSVPEIRYLCDSFKFFTLCSNFFETLKFASYLEYYWLPLKDWVIILKWVMLISDPEFWRSIRMEMCRLTWAVGLSSKGKYRPLPMGRGPRKKELVHIVSRWGCMWKKRWIWEVECWRITWVSRSQRGDFCETRFSKPQGERDTFIGHTWLGPFAWY